MNSDDEKSTLHGSLRELRLVRRGAQAAMEHGLGAESLKAGNTDKAEGCLVLSVLRAV